MTGINAQILIEVRVGNRLAAIMLGIIPIVFQNTKRQQKSFITEFKMNDQKGQPLLFFKCFHKFHLMLVDIGNRQTLLAGFLGVKTDWNTLDVAQIIDGAFFFKIDLVIFPFM